MTEPIFLTPAQVEGYHLRLLELFGGLDGLRDSNQFESAVMQAQNVFAYENGDLYDIAAAYCFYIAQAQAFLDGNKRTAVAAGLAFLELNGVNTPPNIHQPIYEAMIAVANHEINREGLSILLHQLFGVSLF